MEQVVISALTEIFMLYLFDTGINFFRFKIVSISYADIFCNIIPKRKTGSIYNCDNKNGINMIWSMSEEKWNNKEKKTEGTRKLWDSRSEEISKWSGCENVARWKRGQMLLQC